MLINNNDKMLKVFGAPMDLERRMKAEILRFKMGPRGTFEISMLFCSWALHFGLKHQMNPKLGLKLRA